MQTYTNLYQKKHQFHNTESKNDADIESHALPPLSKEIKKAQHLNQNVKFGPFA